MGTTQRQCFFRVKPVDMFRSQLPRTSSPGTSDRRRPLLAFESRQGRKHLQYPNTCALLTCCVRAGKYSIDLEPHTSRPFVAGSSFSKRKNIDPPSLPPHQHRLAMMKLVRLRTDVNRSALASFPRRATWRQTDRNATHSVRRFYQVGGSGPAQCVKYPTDQPPFLARLSCPLIYTPLKSAEKRALINQPCSGSAGPELPTW